MLCFNYSPRTLLTLAGMLAFSLELAPALLAADRFDHEVRPILFAGLGGNEAMLQKGLALCEEVLKADPKHAEALVWHGAALSLQANGHFRKGDMSKGIEVWTRGVEEMSRAVEMAPDNLAVRIPRGAVLLTATRFMPDNPQRITLIRVGLADYEAALAPQEADLATLSEHQKGELFFGLGEGYHRLGEASKARPHLERIISLLPATEYAKRARLLLDGQALDRTQLGCVGCHVK